MQKNKLNIINNIVDKIRIKEDDINLLKKKFYNDIKFSTK